MYWYVTLDEVHVLAVKPAGKVLYVCVPIRFVTAVLIISLAVNTTVDPENAEEIVTWFPDCSAVRICPNNGLSTSQFNCTPGVPIMLIQSPVKIEESESLSTAGATGAAGFAEAMVGII